MRAMTALCLGLLLASASATADDKIRIENEGGIAKAWMLAPGATLPVPAYPAAYAQNKSQVCVAIGYLINPDGTTSDFSLLKSWSSAEPEHDADEYWRVFAEDSSNALARWKFAPRPAVTKPEPVYTVATFLFGATDAAKVRQQCSIPSLSYRLVELRNNKKVARKMMTSDIFSRLDVDPLLEQRYKLEQRQLQEMNRKLETPKPPQQQQPRPPQNPPSGG